MNKLNKSVGVQSTAHPETQRDQMRADKKQQAKGWYNFDESSGKKLMQIKQKRDPKNVFSLASEIKWSAGTNFYNESNGVLSSLNGTYMSPKEMQQPDITQTALGSLHSEGDSSDPIHDTFDEDDDDEGDKGKGSPDGKDLSNTNDTGDNDNESLGEDLKHLFSMTDGTNDDDDDWSFTESTLERAAFDAINHSGKKKGESGVIF